MTYNFYENDHRMSAYVTEKAVAIAKAANPKILGNPFWQTGN
jgi:hypothetical protein